MPPSHRSLDRSPRSERSDADADRRRILLWIGLVFAAATAMGLVATAQAAYGTFRAEQTPFWEMARYWFPDYYIWAALSPLILWLGRRFPVDREGWIRHLPIHMVVAPVLVQVELLASCWVISIIAMIPQRYTSVWEYYTSVARVYLMWGIVIYLFILAAGQAYQYHRQLREREMETAELRRQVVEAQLRALKMQIHPHFLFNTLHSIGTLVRKGEGQTALDMLAGLGDLLRYSLDNEDRQEVPLEEEIEFLRRYLEVEQVRFSDRLRVSFELDDPTLEAAVPNLILQPLVENAIRHGVGPHGGPRRLTVAGERQDGRLRLEVRDDGRPSDPDWRPDETAGVGLRNVRERLSRLYGEEARLTVSAGAEAGVVSVIELPWKRWEDAS
ncbi:MAG TPA: histidine kinase [Gemmatimonadota bacterium]|nr:histidine kinase [Gemmatimonadota bacterium]